MEAEAEAEAVEAAKKSTASTTLIVTMECVFFEFDFLVMGIILVVIPWRLIDML